MCVFVYCACTGIEYSMWFSGRVILAKYREFWGMLIENRVCSSLRVGWVFYPFAGSVIDMILFFTSTVISFALERCRMESWSLCENTYSRDKERNSFKYWINFSKFLSKKYGKTYLRFQMKFNYEMEEKVKFPDFKLVGKDMRDDYISLLSACSSLSPSTTILFLFFKGYGMCTFKAALNRF